MQIYADPESGSTTLLFTLKKEERPSPDMQYGGNGIFSWKFLLLHQKYSVLEPDSQRSLMILVRWIRIRIDNPDLDPGEVKWAQNLKKIMQNLMEA